MWQDQITQDYLNKIKKAQDNNAPCNESDFSGLTFEDMKKKEFVVIKEEKVYITEKGKQQIKN